MVVAYRPTGKTSKALGYYSQTSLETTGCCACAVKSYFLRRRGEKNQETGNILEKHHRVNGWVFASVYNNLSKRSSLSCWKIEEIEFQMSSAARSVRSLKSP